MFSNNIQYQINITIVDRNIFMISILFNIYTSINIEIIFNIQLFQCSTFNIQHSTLIILHIHYLCEPVQI